MAKMCAASHSQRETGGQADREEIIVLATGKASMPLIDKNGGEMTFFATCKCKLPAFV
ncbi:MAG: hypothetical protein ACKO15_13160 [Burkholderiales bacterium]